MKTSDKAVVIRELKAVLKELEDKTNAVGDAGGMQGAAVLYHYPKLKKSLIALGNEAEALGVTEEDLAP